MQINNKKMVYSVAGIFIISLIAFAYAISIIPSSSPTITNPIQYNSMVCVQVTRADGTIENPECSKNLVTNAGLNAIADLIQGTDGNAFDYIGLCNSTTTANDGTGGCENPSASKTALDDEFTDSGLARAQGTILDLKSNTGNSSISKTFTATADGLSTNKTGLFNSSSGVTLLAENTFTTVNLQTNDQLTINWSIWFS